MCLNYSLFTMLFRFLGSTALENLLIRKIKSFTQTFNTDTVLNYLSLYLTFLLLPIQCSTLLKVQFKIFKPENSKILFTTTYIKLQVYQ